MVYRPLSVVIPVKNRHKLITRCLDSVYNQSYRPIRLIVVDNASTDETPMVIARWKETHESDDFSVKIVSEQRPGAAAARNRGLQEVDTDHLLFFDSDDEMRPELAITVMEAFDRNEKLDVIYWRTAIINERDEVRPKRFFRFNLLSHQIYNAFLSTQAYAVRTAFVKRIGGWKSDLLCWDDWELGVRILLNQPNIKGIDRVLVHIHPQSDSITGTDFHSKAGKWETAIDAIEKDFESADQNIRGRLLEMLIYRRVNLAALYKAEGYPELATPLLNQALASPLLTSWERRLLKWIYFYTSHGGRAAYLLWK